MEGSGNIYLGRNNSYVYAQILCILSEIINLLCFKTVQLGLHVSCIIDFPMYSPHSSIVAVEYSVHISAPSVQGGLFLETLE